MKKILAVDIDAITLNIISSLLTEHTTDFEILTTDKIQEMHDIFKSLTIDVAILDLKKPSTNEIEVLKFIAKNYTKTPLIAMTAFETIEIESAIKAIGSLHFFEKPVDFKEMADKIAEVLENSVRGEIHGISLASFLQMSEMEKTSCALKVKTSELEGRLFMTKGALIAAEAGELTGKDAVYEILGWDSPVIEIEDADPTRKKEISTPLMSLLMEGLRRKDEKSGEIDKSKISAKKAKSISIVSSAERIKDISKTKTETASEARDGTPVSSETPDTIKTMATQGRITDAGKILKRKRIIANTIKVAAGLAILVAFAVTWQFIVKPWLAKRDYTKTLAQVQQTRNLENRLNLVNDYLASHPDSQYAAELGQIRSETLEDIKTRDFKETLEKAEKLPIDDTYQSKAEALYNIFLKKYPESEYTEEINKRIAEIPSIIDDADFRALSNIPEKEYSKRLSAYQQYLKTHPDGMNAPKAKAMITQLGENIYQHIKIKKSTCDKQQDWQPCMQLCQYFTSNFQQHDRVDDVRQLQQAMEEQRDLASLTEQAGEEGELSDAARRLYQQYLDDNPGASIRPTLEERIARIDEKNRQESTWQNILAYAKNSNNTIFNRTNRMEAYISSNPPPQYLEEARRVLALLETKKQEELARIARQKALEEEKQEQQAAIERQKQTIRDRMKQSDGRYVENAPDTITDTKTGLTWCMLDSFETSKSCMDYKAAQQYVSGLETGGFDDWRMPDPSELMVIHNDNTAFPAEGAEWYWTVEVFSAAWQKKAHIVKRMPGGAWIKSEMPVESCGTVRAVRP